MAIFAVAWILAQQPVLESPGGINPESICGPRCVQFVLQHSEIDSDLIDLIPEIQGLGNDRGATLEAMKRALESRGLFAYALRVGPNVEISFPCPVILHLAPTSQGSAGHYVVQLPRSANEKRAKIWDGLSGTQLIDRQAAISRRTGAILVASRVPLYGMDSYTKVSHAGLGQMLRHSAVGALVILLAALFCSKRGLFGMQSKP